MTPAEDEVVAEINVTPLTDIFLVLLIVFMVTSTTLTQAGLNVSLPRSRTASSQAQGVTITAAADGTVLVDSQPTTLADMGGSCRRPSPAGASAR